MEDALQHKLFTLLTLLALLPPLTLFALKCGGDMSIRGQGEGGLVFEEKKNFRRIVKEAWKWHLFGQLK